MQSGRVTIVAAAALAAVLGAGAAAGAELVKCQRTILKESSKLARARAKALQKCEDRKLLGTLPGAADCVTEPKTAGNLARAESKLRRALAKACGGADRACGTPDDETPASLGWPGACPDFEGHGCTNTIAGCTDIADCLTCVDDAAVDQAVALYYDGLAPTPDHDLARCRRAIGKEMARFLDAKTKALTRCWDARYKGAHANSCPSPGDGKAAPKIAKAESKARAKLCRACGGADRACGGGDDLAPLEIGLPSICPHVGVCGGVIDGLDTLVDCVACVTEFKVDCTTPLAVPAFAAYPTACNAPDYCPALLQLDGGTGTLDLDLGWTGISHDQTDPWLGRLTLVVSGCTGDGDPTCGTCSLDGPIGNAGGPAFANRRCADQTWVTCTSDADCTAAGAAGPCRFFLGPPQPTAEGGLLSCNLNAMAGPVTGTVDVEAGTLAISVPLSNSVWNTMGIADPSILEVHPCPQCVGGLCDGGPRQGMPCTVQGHGTLLSDDLSLDCPPPGMPYATTNAAVSLVADTQAGTLSAASPSCTAPGYTGFKCLCDTCTGPEAVPCFSDADCPGSNVCGSYRCLSPATNAGDPCAASSDCVGGSCGHLGWPTQPNSCYDGVCTPTGGGEGECAAGPFDGYCSPAQPFRPCLTVSDCAVAGDACIARARQCFLDNGIVGMSITAFGAADPPAGGAFTPTLAGVFCDGPAGVSFVDGVRGLPGPGRASVTVNATLE
jgi:hypothetical protein